MYIYSLPETNKALRSEPVLCYYPLSFGSQSQQGQLHKKKDLFFLGGGFSGRAGREMLGEEYGEEQLHLMSGNNNNRYFKAISRYYRASKFLSCSHKTSL